MEKRLAVINIIAEDKSCSASINEVLSAFGDCVIGRLGLPYKERGVFIITIVVDAEAPTINSVTGKLGMIEGVTAKTMMR